MAKKNPILAELKRLHKLQSDPATRQECMITMYGGQDYEIDTIERVTADTLVFDRVGTGNSVRSVVPMEDIAMVSLQLPRTPEQEEEWQARRVCREHQNMHQRQGTLETAKRIKAHEAEQALAQARQEELMAQVKAAEDSPAGDAAAAVSPS